MKDLSDLFQSALGDLYRAERQILEALPAMAGKASDDDLRAALEQLRRDTAEQVEGLHGVCHALGVDAETGVCAAISGVLAEADQLSAVSEKCETRDAALIAVIQTVAHHEIARYATLIAWARDLGHAQIADLLERNLQREYVADAKLSKLGRSELNSEAA